MKQFLVDSNLGCCYGNAFVKECLGKISSFFVKNGLFLDQKVFIFLVQIRNQRPKINPCAKFQPDWTEDKGSSNSDLERYRKLLDDVILTSYVPEYHHAKFGGKWTTNKGKTKGGTVYILPKYKQFIFYQSSPA